MNEMTIFDKILSGDIPCQKVFEDEHVLAFRDINGQAPVHVLVIPKKRVARFESYKDADASEVGAFFVRVSRIAADLGLEKRGYRIVINNGPDGQQSVEYLHAHILGGRQLAWPPG